MIFVSASRIGVAILNFLVINIVLILIIIVMIVYPFITRMRVKRVAKIIEQEEFRQGMRSAQVIDVRESSEYKRRHIMGARNIPASQAKVSLASLRKDKPIYLYENGKPQLAGNVALMLKKNGYTDLYILKKGLNEWTGKIKEQ